MSPVEQGCLTCWSASLAIKTKTETQRSESTTEAKSVEPLQKGVDNLLVTVSFSLDEETIQQICSTPNPKTTLQCNGQTGMDIF